MNKSIIVLSHRLEDGLNSKEYQRRLDIGIKCFHEYNANQIVLCSETANIQNLIYVHDHDILERQILLQSESTNTIDEAIFCKELLRPQQLIVVSSDYHIYYRVPLIFGYIFGNQYQIQYEAVSTNRTIDKDTMLDQIKSLKYFFKRFNL